MARIQIVKLPGKAVWNAGGTPVPFYGADGITIELMEEGETLSTDRTGDYDESPTNRYVKITMTPTGFTAAAIAVLFSHGSKRMGQSVVPEDDTTLDVHTIDGVRRRIPCAFVYGEPALTAKTGSSILGPVTFYGIVGNDVDENDLDALFQTSNVAWNASDWNKNARLTPAWLISYSDDEEDTFHVIDTVGGLTITTRSTLDEDVSDRLGLVNATISNYVVEAKCAAQNISEADYMAACGFGSIGLGGKRSSLARDLILRATTEDAFITVYDAVLKAPKLGFNAKTTVVRDLMWISMPDFTTGNIGPRLLVTTTDPEA